jgi:metal-responsive CopG/Arc/MetJ family transcriptional regulator
MNTKKLHRGAVSKDKHTSKAVLVYFPKELMPLIDQAVRITDSDRSKLIRNAVRRELSALQLA